MIKNPQPNLFHAFVLVHSIQIRRGSSFRESVYNRGIWVVCLPSAPLFLPLSPSAACSSRPRPLRLLASPSQPAALPPRRCHRGARLLRSAALEGSLPRTRGLLPARIRPARLPRPVTPPVNRTHSREGSHCRATPDAGPHSIFWG